ncbi:tape measure protein [Azospirillum doebereinerae]|uniref:Tape measure protein N-terminal domain-containing protein n=1 Tax=Azospirillum doebereinerae TaxID=92933 RepID=A0A433JDF6_9PROT|nr:tape measure protein [Azospirillum doebereinerae]RUQ74923.1 hypothetical protein EJ913_03370 [Azospirillum doebereinerae]
MAEQNLTLSGASEVSRLTETFASMRRTVDALTEPFARLSQSVARLEDGGAAVVTLGTHFKTLGGHIQTVNGHVSTLRGALVGMGTKGFSFLLEGAANVVEASAEFERYKTILTNVTGSQDKAQASMDWLSDFAKQTPYDLKAAAEAFVSLKLQGIDPMSGTLQKLGDASSALGKPLKETVAAFSNGLSGNMDGLKSFGVTSKTKGDTVTLSFTDKDGVEKTLKAAKTDAEALQKAMLGVFEAKGFDGAMGRMSDTWDGMWERFQESISDFWGMIGDAGVFETLKGKLKTILELIEGWQDNDKLNAWLKQTAKDFDETLNGIETWLRGVDWTKAWTDLSDSVTKAVTTLKSAVDAVGGWERAAVILMVVMNGSLIASVINLGVALGGVAFGIGRIALGMVTLAGGGVVSLAAAFVRLNAAMAVSAGRMAVMMFAPLVKYIGDVVFALRAGYGAMTAFNLAMAVNPMGMVIAGLVALIAGAVLLYQNWDGIAGWFSGLWESVRAAFDEGFVQGVLALLTTFSPVALVARAVNDLIAYFTGVDLYAVGVDWIGGFLDGFKGEWESVKLFMAKAMADLTGWMPEWAREKLGITIPKAEPEGPAGAPVASLSEERAARQARRLASAALVAGAVAAVPAAASPSAVQAVANPIPVVLPLPGVEAVAQAGQVQTMPSASTMAPPWKPTFQPGASPSLSAKAAGFAGGGGGTGSGMASSPFAAPGRASGAIHAPVTVSITVNGVAELDVLRQEAEGAVRRALDEWTARQQSDADASLYDPY